MQLTRIMKVCLHIDTMTDSPANHSPILALQTPGPAVLPNNIQDSSDRKIVSNINQDCVLDLFYLSQKEGRSIFWDAEIEKALKDPRAPVTLVSPTEDMCCDTSSHGGVSDRAVVLWGGEPLSWVMSGYRLYSIMVSSTLNLNQRITQHSGWLTGN